MCCNTREDFMARAASGPRSAAQSEATTPVGPVPITARLARSHSYRWCSHEFLERVSHDSPIRFGWALDRSAHDGSLRIPSLAHVLREFHDCAPDRFPKLGILFHERRHGVEEPEH